MKRKSLYKICRNDIYLAAVLALAAVVLFVCFFVFRSRAAGNTVYITLNGKEYGKYDISNDLTLEIQSENGVNTVEIKDGKVSVTEADCPDGYCISKGRIWREGETVVCLPHRLVVEVRSEEIRTDEFDVIAE